MQCSRCHGFVIREKSLSADNDFQNLTYLRCVNCGNYQFANKQVGLAHVASKPAA